MSREDWLKTCEDLEAELKYEPTEEEIRNYLANESDDIYEMCEDDIDIHEQLYGEYDDDSIWEE